MPEGAFERLLSSAAGPDPEAARAASRALFQVLAEGLADRFEPRLAEVCAELFARVIAFADPSLDARQLFSRYQRVRQIRSFRGESRDVARVFVLSRVTLGADIAVTSVMLDAAKRRFPNAAIWLVGSEKSRELFAADRRVNWLPVAYGRDGTLRERLSAGSGLAGRLSAPDSIVIDPDSRLTQLGVLPASPEENYYFFESRSYGGDGDDSLTRLAQRWVEEVFGVRDATPYIALPLVEQAAWPAMSAVSPTEAADMTVGVAGKTACSTVTVNLGVGENPAKRVPDPFEEELLQHLAGKGVPVVVDLGAGGEEEERVRRAVARCGAPESRLRTWRGSFAELAAMISRSRLYVGYDSAGQHAAAACGTPLVTVFAGFPCARMLARWSPTGPGPKEIVRVDQPDPQAVLERTIAAVDRLIPDRAW